MARDFTNTSSLGSATSAITAQPCTIAYWFKPVASSSNGMALGISDGTNNNRVFFQRLTNADPINARAVTSAGGSASGKATSGLNVTIGQWGHWCGLFPSVASRTIFFNGIDKQTDATGLGAMASLTTFWVAATGLGAASSQRGMFAEIGVWDAVLSDADVALLGASKYAPSMVSPGNLVAYWPLAGVASPEPDVVGGRDLTLTGTVLQADHPPGIVYSLTGTRHMRQIKAASRRRRR